MNKKNIVRVLIWLILIVGLSFITYFNYQIFIVDSVKQDIKIEKEKTLELNQELITIKRKISEFNQKNYEDNRYLLFIPEGVNKSELILNYVNAPLEKVGAKISSTITITEEMPSNINWTNNLNKKNIKAIKVSIVVDIPIEKLKIYFNELQSSVRCIYFGDFKYTVPDNPYSNIKVNMSYYLFYQETT